MPKTAPPFDVASVRERLAGRRIEWFSSVGSTMTVAAELARAGCASGTIVGADDQTAGIGRHGRTWISEQSAGLYVSIVLRPPTVASPIVTLALGLATHEAISEVVGRAPSPAARPPAGSGALDLRWPNDVLLSEKKCAGILAQVESGAIIAGIGINVRQRSFPEGLETPATSLVLEGADVSREDLLVALANAVDRTCTILSMEGTEAIVRLFTKVSSYAAGRRVRAESVEGVTTGLDASGFLVIREDNGIETTILAGGVRPA